MNVNDPESVNAGEQAAVCTLAEYARVVVQIGLTSFGGGVSGWMMRIVVHQKGWMTEPEFLSGLALCQIFPGINVLNLAIWLGYQLHGGAGALVGALAMTVPPGLVLIALGIGFAHLAGIPLVHAALTGVAAAGVGLTATMGIRAARRSASGAVSILLIIATFVAIAVLHWPLVPVVAGFGGRQCRLGVAGGLMRFHLLWTILVVFAPLSFATIGGGQGIVTEVHRQAVTTQGWIPEQMFVTDFALSRLAPGPGSLLVTLIGYQAAGWPGALAASIGIFLPSSLLLYGLARLWARYRGRPWQNAVERGLAPVAAGLILAASFTVLRATNGGWLAWAVALFSTLLLSTTKTSPFAALAAGALVFSFSFWATS